MRFSGLKILKEGLTGNKGWTEHWRNPEPKKEYDILIIGGGGHGLSTAYYLAKNHGIKNIAVLEKGHLGGGNVGRNTMQKHWALKFIFGIAMKNHFLSSAKMDAGRTRM